MMQSMRRIGLATGVLTDYELNLVETQIVKTVRPLLVGRQLMPIRNLPHAGFTKYTFYTESDMGQATISMTGEEPSKDKVDLTEGYVKIPIISKDYVLHWRDVLARRNQGEDLNTQHAENAARQVAEEEDRLILTGGTLAGAIWPALGIEGLCTATGNLAQACGAWPANAAANVAAAKQQLRAGGYYGPYKLVMRSAIYAVLEALIANTEKWYFQAIGELIGGVENILVSDNFYAADGGVDGAMLVDVQPGNFDLLIGSDISNFSLQNDAMNYECKVWEAVVPVIKRPLSIVELTGIT